MIIATPVKLARRWFEPETNALSVRLWPAAA